VTKESLFSQWSRQNELMVGGGSDVGTVGLMDVGLIDSFVKKTVKWRAMGGRQLWSKRRIRRGYDQVMQYLHFISLFTTA